MEELLAVLYFGGLAIAAYTLKILALRRRRGQRHQTQGRGRPPSLAAN